MGILFFNGRYRDKEIDLRSEQVNNQSDRFKISVTEAPMNSRLAVRIPSWASRIELTLAGKKIRTFRDGDYLVLDQTLKKGYQIDIKLEYKMKWLNQDKSEIVFPITGKLQAALFYGPYLMSVDSNFQPFFDSEPSYSNYLILKDEMKFVPELAPTGSNLKNTYLVMQHFHSDMFGKHPVVMRPISETTWQSPCNIRVWFTISQ